MSIKSIKKYIIILLALGLLVSNSIHAQVGAVLIGSSTTTTTTSITLPSANNYFCVAGANGGTITIPSITELVNNGGYAVIGNSSTNSCSITTTATSYALGGISINNYSVFSIITTYTNTYKKSATGSFSFTLSGQNYTVYILIAAGGNKGTAYVSTVTPPSGCTQIFNTPSGTAASVYAAECKDLAPGTYSVSFKVVQGGGSTVYVSALVVGYPIFTFNLTPSNNSIVNIPGKTSNTTIYVTQLTGNTPLQVNLSCSTSNANLGCYFSSNSVVPNNSVTLYINSTTGIAPGTYTVTVNGIAENNATNSTTITVTVPPETINVSANPNQITLIPGESKSSTITASDNYGNSLNISASCPSQLICSFNGQTSVIVPNGGSTILNITVLNSASQGTYTINVTATDIVTNQTQVNVIVVIESVIITLNQSSGNVNPGQSISLNVSANNTLGNNMTLECLSPSEVTCSPTQVNITSGSSYIFTITAPSNVNNYQQYNITFLGIDVNTDVLNSSIFTLNVYPYPQTYIISPSNNTVSNYYALNITFYTNSPTVNVTINGNTYTINVTPGNNLIQLLYNNSSYGLPGLHNIIPNGGNLTIQIVAFNPLGETNSTGVYVYTLPAPVLNVSYVSPTPANGTVSNYWLLQIYGNVYDNTLGQDYCNIQFLNQSNNQWVTIATSCSDVFYNGLLQQYSTFNGQYYVLWYRIYGYNNYGLSYTAPAQVIYYSPNAQSVSVVNNSLSNSQIEGIIQGAINSSTPIVVFTPGAYLVNLVIDPQGRSITLLGSGNTVFEPANPGLPVIDVLSSNVTIQNININTNLFAVRLENGTLNLINDNINSGLFGVQVTNPSTLNIYNTTINGNIGSIYAPGSIQNSTINNANIQSSVWGIYINNPYNVIINSSDVNGQIFGIDLEGNAVNNYIINDNVQSNIFGIKIPNGINNYIGNNYINSNIFGIYLTSSGNTINNVTINVGQVFGLYVTQPNNVSNVITNGGIFGVYLTGNATNISIYNSQLGADIFGQGIIYNLTTSTGSIIYQYNGQGMINSVNSIISSANVNGLQYNYVAGISLIGSPQANITFLYNNPSVASYIVEKIVAGMGSVISTNETFVPSGFGNYELFYS